MDKGCIDLSHLGPCRSITNYYNQTYDKNIGFNAKVNNRGNLSE